MKNKFILIVLSGYFFCADPGMVSKIPLRIIDNWFTGNSSRTLDSLNDLIMGAKTSVECTFSDLDTGYSLDLNSKTTLDQKSILEIAHNIINKRNTGINVTLIFDTDKKCISNGSLFFQYPDFFLNNAFANFKYKDIIKDCNFLNSDIPLDLLQNVKQNGLVQNHQIYFVNTNGKMSNNYCIIDKKKIWFSLNPLTRSILLKPSISFILEADGNPIIEEFTKEIEMLKNNLTGSLKKPFQNIQSYNFYNSTWHIIHGPQDKPLDYLSSLIDSSETLNIYTSGIDFDIKNPVVNSLVHFINTKSKIDTLFADTSFFYETSLYQNLFNNGNYCLNNPDCANNFNYFYIKPETDKQHIFLLKDIVGNKKTILYNGDLKPLNEKNDDTLLIEINSEAVYDELLSNFNKLSNKSLGIEKTLQSSPLPSPGDVVISEIVWMGSFDNLRKSHPSDEAIELFNTTNHNINIGEAVIACTASIFGDSVISLFSIPKDVVLLPGQYFSIASNQNTAFTNVNLIVPNLSISNLTRECLLIDNRKPALNYYPANSINGHYNDSRLTGIILDQVLNYKDDPWNLYAFQYFSKTGLNTVKYNIEGEGVRSMEKISPTADGKLLRNWHMNTFTPVQNLISDEFIFHTFTSMGYENSPSTETSDGSVIISEIHWMGSYNALGVSNASDEFVEFYNRSTADKNIGGWIFGCSTDTLGAVGKPLFAIPYGTVIQPGEYLTVQKIGAMSFLNIDYTLDFTINNTITQCILTDGNFIETSFQGSDSNGDGVLSGHYDSPLFIGSIADMVSDRSSSFASLSLGINNTTTKIRRSCERIDVSTPGNTPLNWKFNTIVDSNFNLGLYPDFKSNTFATPGMPNSR
ncbi:MAG: lamin tail domain-containing protein [Spirochaetia bacterium]|nr:lamin tail domain-containing protein [Spirochaetia bacterium]